VTAAGGRAAAAAATVGDALRAAAAALEAAGVAEPRREAAELYASLVRGPTSAAWTGREGPLPAGLLCGLATAVARRAAGWPQAYATGWAAFRGHWLRVDERVLIPRPETEGLVELVLAWARRTGGGAERSAAPVAVDVGTGSGAIAASLALEGPFAWVFAVDREDGALRVARSNAAALGAASRVRCLRADLLESLAGGVAHAVVSNPPYVATAELTDLEPSVRRFEPRAALDGGADGLAPTRRLATASRGVLAPGGLLALEVDARRAAETAALLREAGFLEVQVRTDLFERPRYVTALQPGER
jgi:release factor glutamine methyltransferase